MRNVRQTVLRIDFLDLGSEGLSQLRIRGTANAPLLSNLVAVVSLLFFNLNRCLDDLN